ncbi:MAG TPA: O-antigen ligase family protein [Terracidiphilus sp.]|nr:O-antigen ligase family protein [Terracidiphilus sp.]
MQQSNEKSITAARPQKPSAWLWVPWIWLFFASTRTISTWLLWDHRDTASALDLTSPADEVVMIMLMILGLYVLGVRAQRVKRILNKNKWVIVLFLYMAMTIIWSNFPGISLRRDVRSTGVLIMVLVVLSERDPLAAVRTLLWRLFVVHIPLSVLAIKFMRSIGVVYDWSGTSEQWVGLTTDKNSMGQVAMCAGIFFLWLILQGGRKKKQVAYVILLAATLWILRGSRDVHSSTAILGFVTSALVLIGLQCIRGQASRAKRIVAAATITSAFLAPAVYIAFLAFGTTPVEAVLHATGRDITLTDRTRIWTDLLNDASKSPVLGVGIGAFWVGDLGIDKYPMPNWSEKTPEWRPSEGHNGYLDTYVELGAVGLLLLLIVIGAGARGALDTMQHDFLFGSLRAVMLLAILTNNVAETSFLKGTHDLWFLFLLTAINVPPLLRKATKPQPAAEPASAPAELAAAR